MLARIFATCLCVTFVAGCSTSSINRSVATNIAAPASTKTPKLNTTDIANIAKRVVAENRLDWGEPVEITWQKRHNRYLVIFATPEKERLEAGDRGVFVETDGEAYLMPQG